MSYNPEIELQILIHEDENSKLSKEQSERLTDICLNI